MDVDNQCIRLLRPRKNKGIMVTEVRIIIKFKIL